MRILAIETSCLPGSVAMLDADQIVCSKQLPLEEKTIQTLAPSIQALLAEGQWQPNDLDLIAVSIGPGSFTGLRIGVITAKCLAYASNANVVGINTLAASAFQVPGEIANLHVIMDAQRKQLFSAIYHKTADHLQCITEVKIMDMAKWVEQFPASHRVTGPGLEKLQSQIPTASVVDELLWIPKAESVGLLAYQKAQQEDFDDLWSLVPQYYRASAAEEKLQRTQDALKTSD